MFSDPSKNIVQLELSPGLQVADLGSGAGYYAEAIARVIGPTGKVFAVDVQQELLKKIKTAAEHARLENIEVIWGDIERLGGTKLNDISVDRVLAANVLFQMADKKTFAAEVRRILKPGGLLVAIDWRESFGGIGPAPAAVVAPSDAKAFFTGAGFSFLREFEAGEHHYGLVFKNG